MQVRPAQSEELTIFDLPYEMVLKISSYLSSQALFYLSLASRAHYSLILTDEIWKKKFIMHFDCDPPHQDGVFVQFRNFYEEDVDLRLSFRQRELLSYIKENDLQSIEENQFTLADLDNNNFMLNWANRGGYQEISNYFYSLAIQHFTDNESKLNVTARDVRKRSTFEFAITCNQSLEELNRLLDQGALIKGASKGGWQKSAFKTHDADYLTPLMLAAAIGRKEIVAFLLDKGGLQLLEQRSFPWGGATALMIAVLAGEASMVEYLINKGANVAKRVGMQGVLSAFFAPLEKSDTPLIAAIRLAKVYPQESCYKAMIEALIASPSQECEGSAKSPYYSPLAIASTHTDIALIILREWRRLDLAPNYQWIEFNCISYIKLLHNLKKLCELQKLPEAGRKLRKHFGKEAEKWQALCASPEEWKQLESRLPSLNVILQKAIILNRVEIVRFLLRTKACDANYVNLNNLLSLKTLLMYARSPVITKLLLNAGANPALENAKGHNALFYAVKRGDSASVDLLLENLNTEGLLTKTYYPNGISHIWEGDTLFHMAARGGNPDIIASLARANFSLITPNARGELPADVLQVSALQSSDRKLKNYIYLIRPSEKSFHYTFKIAGHKFFAKPITIFGRTYNLEKEKKLAAARDLYAVVFEEKNIDLSKHRACYFNGRLGRIYKELENKGLISRYQLSPMGLEQSTLDYELPELG